MNINKPISTLLLLSLSISLFVTTIALTFMITKVASNVEAINRLAEETNNLRIDMMGHFDFYKKLAVRLVDLEERVMILEYYLLQSLRAVPK